MKMMKKMELLSAAVVFAFGMAGCKAETGDDPATTEKAVYTEPVK
jgi:hypothetical protein